MKTFDEKTMVLINAGESCCFCGKPLDKYNSNNPDPADTIDGHRCCGKCDQQIVMPARGYIAGLIQRVIAQ